MKVVAAQGLESTARGLQVSRYYRTAQEGLFHNSPTMPPSRLMT